MLRDIRETYSDTSIFDALDYIEGIHPGSELVNSLERGAQNLMRGMEYMDLLKSATPHTPRRRIRRSVHYR